MHTGFLFSGNILPAIFAPTASFGFTFFASTCLCGCVRFLRLEDVPNDRKRHAGKVPMVGGLSVFSGLLVGSILVPSLTVTLKIPLFFGFLILLLGAMDDAWNIRPDLRLFCQVIIILCFIYVSGLRLFSFGDLLFGGDIVFMTMSGLFTLLAFCAGINAFNMIDGIDGLAALMGIVALASMAFLFYPSMPDYFLFNILLCSSLLAFFCRNLGLFPLIRKIFLGDAGSMFLGFILAFLLIQGSQEQIFEGNPVMRPVTCLWLIAIPLMDMVGIMLRRILRGQSPIRGDRNHLHHLLLDMGFSQGKVLLVMGMASVFFASVGILGEVYNIREGFMFFSFLFFFVLYFLLVAGLLKSVAKRKANTAGK